VTTELAVPGSSEIDTDVVEGELVAESTELQVIERHDFHEVKLHLVNSVEMAGKFMSWLGERHGSLNVVACDTETGGLEFWKRELRLVQFGDPLQGWAIPWQRWGGVVEEAFEKIAVNRDLKLAGHNWPFDAKFIEHHSDIRVPWHLMHDTRPMAHIIDPTGPTGLKPLSARLIDSKAVAGQRLLDDGMTANKWDWDTVPIDFPPYWIYAAMDCVLTSRLLEHFWRQIMGNYRQVYELEMATARILSEMERRGARIDLEYTERKRGELEEYCESCRTWVLDNHGVHIGSNQKIVQRMQELGHVFRDEDTTATGAYKLDKEVLQGIIGLDDRDERVVQVERTDAVVLAELVYAHRKQQKIISTYLDNFIKNHDDGFLHPSINQLGARTGRMSITQPALQTLPRGDVVRNCFIPRDGNVLISTDYDQVEARLVAHFAQDKGLVDAFAADEDFFTVVARNVNGDQGLQKKDIRRQWTKNAFYALLYGAGVPKMAKTAKVPVEQMQGVVNGIHRSYPGIKTFQHRVETVAAQRAAQEGEPYVIDPFGRKQVAESLDKAYALTNYLIQGAAASILKQALVNMDLMGLGDALVLPVHDEVILDLPKADVEDALPVIKDAMLNVGDWLVPLTAGAEIMERWSKS
jgi:DNA polymerase-1